MDFQKLPNSQTVLILGIAAILGSCCCNGIVGIICGIIGLQLYKKDLALYTANPSAYSDFNNLKTGRILCIIGLVMGILFLAYFAYQIATLGVDGYMQQIEDMYKAMGVKQ